MSLGLINIAKELAVGYKPLLLATFTFTDATVLRLATRPLNAAEGGFSFPGTLTLPAGDYFSRIQSQDIAAVQAMSDQGIDIPPNASIHIADGDRFIYINYERAHGFKGATLTLDFAFFNAATGEFSSDSQRRFTGICSAPSIDDTVITVGAVSLLNLSRVSLPVVPIQIRCPWVFPRTHADRLDAANKEDSQFFECGYSPDAGGANALGATTAPNQTQGLVPLSDASGNYVLCNYTKGDCQARGMYDINGSGKGGRYGGVQWDPPLTWGGKAYLSGSNDEGINSINEAKYRDYVPMVYGAAFVEPVIANVLGDPNSSRFEAILCLGAVGRYTDAAGVTSDGVITVVVNDTMIPNVAVAPRDNDLFKTYRWFDVNTGERNGAFNTDALWDGQSDPYGSMKVIGIVVPRRVAESSQIPKVKVLIRGPAIKFPSGGDDISDSSFWPKRFTGNPIWHIMDLLTWVNWRYSQFDMRSFADAADVCDATIPFTDLTGSPNSHQRYQASLAIRQRRPASDIIRGLRLNCKAILAPNSSTGMLQIFIKQTLADQQPAAVSGSNYNAPILSKHANGSAGTGFSAYLFDESTILRRGGKSTLTISQRTNADSPNRLALAFQDADRAYAADSISQVDSEDVGRVGQEIQATFPAEGIPNYDQAKRVFATELAETYRGNPRHDTGGTMQFEFESSSRTVHLRVGHLCHISWQPMVISLQMIRIIRLQPTTDFETCKITAIWAEDDWYTDLWGQGPDPMYSRVGRDRLDRPPYPWMPNYVQPVTGDPLYPPFIFGIRSTEWLFGLAQTYTVNGGTVIPQIVISGVQTINVFSPSAMRPFFTSLAGATAPAGGLLAGDTDYFIAVCGLDADGLYTTPQSAELLTKVHVPLGTNFNTVSALLFWPDTVNTVGWAMFAGKDPNYMCLQGTSLDPQGVTSSGPPANPTTLTLTLPLNIATQGMPDVEFDHLLVRVKSVIRSGVFTAVISSVTGTTITIDGATWADNQWAGYSISILGLADGIADELPIYDFIIDSNTADTLTIAVPPGPADITALTPPVDAGQIVVMRTKLDTFTDTTVGDSNYVHNTTPDAPESTTGLTPDEAKGAIARIIAGTARGQWRNIVTNSETVITVDPPFDPPPGSDSVVIIEEQNWQVSDAPTPVKNADGTNVIRLNTSVDNFQGQMMYIEVFSVKPDGSESVPQRSPGRELYLWGSGGSTPAGVTQQSLLLTY